MLGEILQALQSPAAWESVAPCIGAVLILFVMMYVSLTKPELPVNWAEKKRTLLAVSYGGVLLVPVLGPIVLFVTVMSILVWSMGNFIFYLLD